MMWYNNQYWLLCVNCSISWLSPFKSTSNWLDHDYHINRVKQEHSLSLHSTELARKKQAINDVDRFLQHACAAGGSQHDQLCTFTKRSAIAGTESERHRAWEGNASRSYVPRIATCLNWVFRISSKHAVVSSRTLLGRREGISMYVATRVQLQLVGLRPALTQLATDHFHLMSWPAVVTCT
jgi:hypothetical protein